MNTTRDGYSHSWSDESENSWETFRQLVRSGMDVQDAARIAGLSI